MANVHMIIGTLVVVGYLALVVVYFLGMRGKTIGLARPLSMAAGAALLVQYMLGFSLLGGTGEKPQPLHYVLALAAIVTVGAEHALAPGQETPEKRSRVAFVAALGTLILVAVAYSIGQNVES